MTIERLLSWRNTAIAVLAAVLIVLHLLFVTVDPAGPQTFAWQNVPLFAILGLGGLPLLIDLLRKAMHREFGSDLLAGISIVTSVILGEYLAGSIVVLMLAGGSALEFFAIRRASSMLEILANRMPCTAHERRDARITDVALDQVAVGAILVVLPHETCPVDGTVVEGYGHMDESYLTGEPYQISKAPGSMVLSGAINGDSALVIRAGKLVANSRYASIMKVMRASAQQRPRMRRLADRIGAWYTPVAVVLAVSAWLASDDPRRFLGVLVVATPCPLLIAIPVSIMGAISLSAKRGIIIKDPAILEAMDTCNIAIFDKTGTLTIGQPRLTAILPQPGIEADQVLRLVASIEQYSKHPLAQALCEEAQNRGLALDPVAEVREPPGEGLTGRVGDQTIRITNRRKLLLQQPAIESSIPPTTGGLECVVLIDDAYAATLRFHDHPRREGKPFIEHLKPMHHFERVMLVSGDREMEVRYLAEAVGIDEVYAAQSPEQKCALVRDLSKDARTLFVGDGINDAPAIAVATVGLALGHNSDVTTDAARAVILDSSLMKVDELIHISRHLRRIALQSALGGMALSIAGMILAAIGILPPVAGAICQEAIDVLAIANALRVAFPPKSLTDY